MTSSGMLRKVLQSLPTSTSSSEVGSGKGLSRKLVSLLALTVIGMATYGSTQSAPPGFEITPLEGSEDSDLEFMEIYDLVEYEKSRTQFDGVTNENVVTYL